MFQCASNRRRVSTGLLNVDLVKGTTAQGSLVRLHLEYAVQFCLHTWHRDAGKSSTQDDKEDSATDKFKYVSNVYTLQERRCRGDLILLFKLIKQGNVGSLDFYVDIKTRDHGLKLYKPKFKHEWTRHCFFTRDFGFPDDLGNS